MLNEIRASLWSTDGAWIEKDFLGLVDGRNSVLFLVILLSVCSAFSQASEKRVNLTLEKYCIDCHDEDTRKGDLDLFEFVDQADFDGTLIFENLLTRQNASRREKAAHRRREKSRPGMVGSSTEGEPASSFPPD